MDYILGLDLGAQSLGWAAVEYSGESENRLLGLGVRIFEAGMEGRFDKGREESRAATRRVARNQRRQTRRRRQRARRLYHELSSAGLLPAISHTAGRPEGPEIQKAINALDAELRLKHLGAPSVQQLPYLLRARALDYRLEPFELGRALYHFGQRRGFQSSRKARAKTGEQADEEKGKVYGGIKQLREQMQSGCRTLGEYLASVDPNKERIRRQYTHRQMYRDEFELICNTQRTYHAVLTPAWKSTIERLLFSQKELRSNDDKIGRCEWIQGEPRARLSSLEFQRFRLLQTATHLRIQDRSGLDRPLTSDQRQRLVERLDSVREISFRSAKKLLGLPDNTKFSLEEGKETKLKGNAVGSRFLEYLPDLWNRSDDATRQALVTQITDASSDEELVELLVTAWSVDRQTAEIFVQKVTLPAGYASLSLKAIRGVIPWLEQGLSVQEARQAAGFDIQKKVKVLDFLPPVNDSRLDVRNPAVIRSLTELRKVVNAVVRRWGKPREIHIELARELKKNRDARVKDTDRMRKREAVREAMRARIEGEIGIPRERIHRKEIDLGLLYDECRGICPYTGDSLGSFSSLFSGQSRVQVEHIIPRSLSLEDFFDNLTLATVDANASKGNRTPFEAFGADAGNYESIIERVKGFKGEAARHKLARFRLEDTAPLLDAFGSRQLNDTRYASRVAGDYLAFLYGARNIEGRQRIFNLTGQLTADLRGLWNLNTILSGDGNRPEEGSRNRKSRDDHRHHAIDAVVIALFRQFWVTELSQAAARSWKERKRRYAGIPVPWVGFKEDVESAIQSTNVSVRPDHRISGSLHKETFYSKVGTSPAGGDVVRTRKPVHLLKEAEAARIADPRVREVVLTAIKEAGDAKKLENNWPVLPNSKGAPVPIKSVRFDLNKAVKPVGSGYKQRFAEGSETHHVALYEVGSGKRASWERDVVPMSEAMQRLRLGRAVVDRSEKPGRQFLFSLCKNDTVEITDPATKQTDLRVVKKIGQQQIFLVRLNDARPEVPPEGRFQPRYSGLRRLAVRKVVVDPLGEMRASHD